MEPIPSDTMSKLQKVVPVRDMKSVTFQFVLPSQNELWKTKPREWLDTFNILDVMEQYELTYPDFKFFGPVPIDFDLKDKFNKCVVSELCAIDLSRLNNQGVKKIGVIFNLDKHNEPGSHWIGMYMDLTKNLIGYWDSYGYKPPSEVCTLMKKLKQQSKNNGYNPTIKNK